jgi:hypothetical protein
VEQELVNRFADSPQAGGSSGTVRLHGDDVDARAPDQSQANLNSGNVADEKWAHAHSRPARLSESWLPNVSIWELFKEALQSPVGQAVQGSVTVFTIDCLTAVGFYLIVIYMPTYFQVRR